MLSRPKVAGIPVRRSRALVPGGGGAFKSVVHEAQQVGREIGKAGVRLGVGDVSMEVQSGRKEQRDSPLEVLLNGLTNRRSKNRQGRGSERAPSSGARSRTRGWSGPRACSPR